MAAAQDRIARALGLGEGELPKAIRLVSLIFVVSGALVMLKSAQNSYFLMAYPKSMIPRAFVASALALAVVSLVSVPLAARLGAGRLAMGALGACALVVLALRALIAANIHGAPFAMYVVIEATSGVLLIQSWSVVSQATTARSAKRLLPTAGAGATIAWTLGGLLVPPIAHNIGTAALLLLAPILLIVGVFLVAAIRRSDLGKTPMSTRKRSVVTEWSHALAFIRSVPLMRVMTALSVLALVTEQLMDFILMSMAHERYRTEASCAAFFGTFYGITSAITLTFVTLISSRLLLALGTSRALLLTPALTAGFAVLASVVPGFQSSVALRGIDRILKQSIWSSASEQTQTPLPSIERIQSRALVRGVIAPMAYAGSAVVLALLPHGANVRLLASGVLVGVAIMTVVCLTGVRNAYREALRSAIDERSLDFDEAVPELDAETRKNLEAELRSSDPRRAQLAAEVLCESDVAASPETVSVAAKSPLPSVRQSGMRAAARWKVDGAEAVALAMLEGDVDPLCRIEALRTLRAFDRKTDARDAALQKIVDSDRDRDVRAHARAILRRDDPALLDSEDDATVMAALESATATRENVRAIRTLLIGDRRTVLRLAAVDAAVRLREKALMPQLLALLAAPGLGPEVATRLVEWGDDALHAVEAGVDSASPESVRFVASVLSTALGPHSSAHARSLLLRLLDHTDAEVRDRAVRSLSYAVTHGTVPEPPEKDIEPLLSRELLIVYKHYAILAGLAKDDGVPDWNIDPPFDKLGTEIEREVAGVRERVLHLLSLTGNRELASAVEAGLRRSSPEVDAKIAELVDATLGRALAVKVVPLFERLSLRERADAARAVADGTSEIIRDPLSAIMDLGDPNIRGSAMLIYGERFRARYPRLYAEDAPLIPIFERMAFLRTVPLFEELPGAELRRVADMLEKVEHRAGETIFKKGDPGDDLYIVLRGAVSLRDGAVELNVAKEQDFFGELALLDNEARSADAVVLDDVALLRLRTADFRELMARRPQIQERIIRVLVRRLRDMTGRITKLP